MKYIISYSILFMLGAVLFFGCAETKYDLTEPQEVSVHADGVMKPMSDNFHGQLVRDNDWSLFECQQCHGANYAGGKVFVSCLKCHQQDSGPEACNTCHGDFSDPTMIAPPQGTNNETLTTQAAVGAHQKHLYGIQISKNVPCSECHSIPSQFNSAGHIDGNARAEVLFGEYANIGDSTTTYNFEQTTCENTYCHGNFAFDPGSGVLIVGNYFDPNWTIVDGTQGACGTCHGRYNENGELVTPLPVGHPGEFEATDCWNCHTSVVDQQGNIISTEKHINGEANVFGN